MCMRVCDVMDQLLGVLYEKKKRILYVRNRPLSLSVCPDLPAAKVCVGFS